MPELRAKYSGLSEPAVETEFAWRPQHTAIEEAAIVLSGHAVGQSLDQPYASAKIRESGGRLPQGVPKPWQALRSPVRFATDGYRSRPSSRDRLLSAMRRRWTPTHSRM